MILLSATRYFQYDAVGNLTRAIDRNGRITRYEYDRLYRQTEDRKRCQEPFPLCRQ